MRGFAAAAVVAIVLAGQEPAVAMTVRQPEQAAPAKAATSQAMPVAKSRWKMNLSDDAFAAAGSNARDATVTYDLGHGFSLGFDAAYAMTSSHQSLTQDGSPLASGRAGFALFRNNWMTPGDQLGFEIAKPLRAYDSAAFSGTDTFGFPIATMHTGLVSQGSETDVLLNYSLPFDGTTSGNVSLLGRENADDIQGQHDVAALVSIKHNF